MYHLILANAARKSLEKLPKGEQERIQSALHLLTVNPFEGKKLEGKFSNGYVLRVWPYRIIYRINKAIITVVVLAIGHRQGIYKRLSS